MAVSSANRNRMVRWEFGLSRALAWFPVRMVVQFRNSKRVRRVYAKLSFPHRSRSGNKPDSRAIQISLLVQLVPHSLRLLVRRFTDVQNVPCLNVPPSRAPVRSSRRGAIHTHTRPCWWCFGINGCKDAIGIDRRPRWEAAGQGRTGVGVRFPFSSAARTTATPRCNR